MRKTLLLAIIAVLPAPTFAEEKGNLWPWANQNAPAPPKVKPYEIPTFGDKRNLGSLQKTENKAR